VGECTRPACEQLIQAATDKVKALKDLYGEFDKQAIIRVKYHADIEPVVARADGNWIDLRAAETVQLDQFEYGLISLGVSMKLPDGYEAHIAPRSSTFKNFGIIQANGVGIIDSSYSGDGDIWKFPAFAFVKTVIHKGDRICQFRIVESQPDVVFETVDVLYGEDRGGFGSTGVN